MRALGIARAMSAADGASIGRDPLLRGMVVVPLGLAAAVRWLLPGPAARLGELVGFDMMAVYGLFFSYVLLLLAPLVCGMVGGFLLLDARDEQALRALRVTPLPLWVYLGYRLAAPVLLSAVMTLAALPLAGLAPERASELAALVLVSAPLAPLTALFLAGFAENKVQGFALQKGLSLAVLAPVAATLLPQPWQLLAGLLPTAWPGALLLELDAGAGGRWDLLAGGLAYQAALIALLLRRFASVSRRS